MVLLSRRVARDITISFECLPVLVPNRVFELKVRAKSTMPKIAWLKTTNRIHHLNYELWQRLQPHSYRYLDERFWLECLPQNERHSISLSRDLPTILFQAKYCIILKNYKSLLVNCRCFHDKGNVFIRDWTNVIWDREIKALTEFEVNISKANGISREYECGDPHKQSLKIKSSTYLNEFSFDTDGDQV